MKIFFLFLTLASLTMHDLAHAKTTKKHSQKIATSTKTKVVTSKKAAKAQESKSTLEKKMIFSDQMVRGKYQVPGEGLVTVENEKPLLNLISIRSDFKDRRVKEMQRD